MIASVHNQDMKKKGADDNGKSPKPGYGIWTLIFLAANLLLGGCSKTIQEQKPANGNTGSLTQVNFTGSKLKLVHDF